MQSANGPALPRRNRAEIDLWTTPEKVWWSDGQPPAKAQKLACLWMTEPAWAAAWAGSAGITTRRHDGDHDAAAAEPADLRVIAAPTDVVLADDSVVQPDLLVVDRDEFADESTAFAPMLAVEILSPSTRRIDLALKRSRYEAAAIPAYWVVDPDAPEIIAWELRDDEYVEVGRAAGPTTLTLTRPFPIEIVPDRLLD